MPVLVKRLGSFVLLCALFLTLPVSSARAGAQEDGPAQTIFDFRSNFWVNLHHFLYQEALKQKRAQEGGQGKRASDGASVPVIVQQVEGLTPEQQRSWQSALDYYRKEVVGRDLLFNEGLVDINRRLAQVGQATTLKFSGISDAGFVSTLESAAPVYRLKWWAEHDRANRKWIADLFPLVVKHGAALTKQLAAAYRTEWQKARVPVEVTTYANWSGAYTVVEPTLITISSVSSANQGNAALEIVFHEASHGLVRPVSRALAEKFEAQKKPVPRDLWHAVLFYTTGEIVRRRLAETGLKDYQPYADAHGLFTRGAWQTYRPVIAREWQPYLDGKVDFETAVTRLVSAL